MNNMSSNVPWKLSDCTINKNDVNFFVKLVHVDRYRDTASAQGPNRRSKSVSVNRKRESELRRNDSREEEKDPVMPGKIISSISLWEGGKKGSRNRQLKSMGRPLDVSKYRTQYSRNTKIGMQNISVSEAPSKYKRFHTEHINQSNHRSTNSEYDTSFNKAFFPQSKVADLILKTQPTEKEHFNYRNALRSKSNKKQTMTQLLQYRKQKAMKKKDYHLKKFKTTLNNAKFTNLLPKPEKPL